MRGNTNILWKKAVRKIILLKIEVESELKTCWIFRGVKIMTSGISKQALRLKTGNRKREYKQEINSRPRLF